MRSIHCVYAKEYAGHWPSQMYYIFSKKNVTISLVNIWCTI